MNWFILFGVLIFNWGLWISLVLLIGSIVFKGRRVDLTLGVGIQTIGLFLLCYGLMS